jgi:hypothetical protein
MIGRAWGKSWKLVDLCERPWPYDGPWQWQLRSGGAYLLVDAANDERPLAPLAVPEQTPYELDQKWPDYERIHWPNIKLPGVRKDAPEERSP